MKRALKSMAPRIESSAWEQHREKIKRLYITEDRKLQGKDGVIEIMIRDDSFHAR